MHPAATALERATEGEAIQYRSLEIGSSALRVNASDPPPLLSCAADGTLATVCPWTGESLVW